MTAEPVSDERLRQAVRDVLAEELAQDSDQSRATRRQVLGSIAAGGVLGGIAGAGSAAGAVGGEDTSGMVGALAGPPYKVADPGLYSGPDSSKSSISHSVGQVHFAQNTGARYYDDGSNWDLLPLEATAVNNTVNATHQPGATLAEQVENAVSALEGQRGTIHVTPNNDDTRYSWGKDVTLSPPNDKGYEIVVAPGVEIEYPGSGIAITLEGAGVGGTIPTVDVVGGKWIATGTPTGFIRYQDSRNCVVAPRQVSDFANGSNDAFGIQFRNLDSFCERNWVRLTKFSNVDINIDYKDDSASGTGTSSMVGNRVDWPVLNYNTYGIRLEGNHKTNYFGQVEAFPNAEDSSAIYMDGDMKNVVFMAPRFDDPPDAYTNTAAFETGPDFFANPTVFSPHYNQIANKIVRNSSGHRVFEFGYDPTDGVFKIGDIDTDKFYINPLGWFGTIDSGGTEQFKVDNSGNFQTVGNFNATPRFVSRTEYAQEDLTGTTPASDDVAFHDGSGTPSQSLCFADGAGNWYNIVDGNTF